MTDTDRDLQQLRDRLHTLHRQAAMCSEYKWSALALPLVFEACEMLGRVGERIRELEDLVAKSGNRTPDVRADAASETVWLGRRSPEHPWIVLTEQVAAGTGWEVREVSVAAGPRGVGTGALSPSEVAVVIAMRGGVEYIHRFDFDKAINDANAAETRAAELAEALQGLMDGVGWMPTPKKVEGALEAWRTAIVALADFRRSVPESAEEETLGGS